MSDQPTWGDLIDPATGQWIYVPCPFEPASIPVTVTAS